MKLILWLLLGALMGSSVSVPDVTTLSLRARVPVVILLYNDSLLRVSMYPVKS